MIDCYFLLLFATFLYQLSDQWWYNAQLDVTGLSETVKLQKQCQPESQDEGHYKVAVFGYLLWLVACLVGLASQSGG